MRVAAAHDLDGGPPRDTVVLDLEHEPPRTVAGEEVLDRLRALAAAPRRTDACAEREQRRAEIAALGLASGRRAEVAAQGGAPPNLGVADVPREPCEHLVVASGELRDAHHRADPDDAVVGPQPVEAAPVEHERARRADPARGDVR